ncbi:carboxylesterase/lipase family protein [Inquilinus sp.]|uniref:carboxylesterase/lipase family protein n=1 Tax=Inquilinus sp. TaxID=1932117 RepID=UPI0037832FBE
MLKNQISGLRRLFRTIGASLAVAATGLALSQPVEAATRPALAFLQYALVVGQERPGFKQFLGIRYAQPPVGPMRWKPPRPAGAAFGLLKADAFAPHCPQKPSAFGTPSTNEDCLFLNVFAPRDAIPGSPYRPVMVWIHGGSLNEGESDDFDPTRLVGQGVVVVTINYRLGALGFLAHPALEAEGRPGVNYGLLDQQAALRWVRDNIAGFGGDPRNVTIFGQSAGAQSVLSHLVAPASRGLFARALGQSGAYSLILPTLAQAQDRGTAFAAQAGCADQSADCLRRLPVATVLANQGTGFRSTILDGTVLPESIDTALAKGRFTRVPVLIGSNHDEGRAFVAGDFDLAGGPLTAAGYDAFVRSRLAAAADQILGRYPLGGFASPGLTLAAVETDAIFSCNTLRAGAALARFTPVFQYEFSDEAAPQIFLPPVSFPYGAAHTSEVPYLFDRFVPPGNASESAPLSPGQRALSASMVRYWTNFAKRGDPNGIGVPDWRRVGAGNAAIQSLAGSPKPTFGFATDHQCGFWTPIISTQPLPLG